MRLALVEFYEDKHVSGKKKLKVNFWIRPRKETKNLRFTGGKLNLVTFEQTRPFAAALPCTIIY